ncbi:cytochrome b5 [Copidosoma floridanum]|uniref:cytochrome b5 n=1 Tax=Copidosoma floridanum TaxID=29053 RepID=UPI0006C987B4|nr:cytochrome b5 [Copidosoma floridanum]
MSGSDEATSSGEQRQYTFAEVAGQCSESRTLIAIHDRVYDVTRFLNEHPGGEEILLDHAGKDASEDFDDVGHSSDALELMKKYLVGEIVPRERRNLPRKEGWKAGYNTNNPENEKYVDGPGFPFFIFAGACAVALLAIYYLAF